MKKSLRMHCSIIAMTALISPISAQDGRPPFGNPGLQPKKEETTASTVPQQQVKKPPAPQPTKTLPDFGLAGAVRKEIKPPTVPNVGKSIFGN